MTLPSLIAFTSLRARRRWTRQVYSEPAFRHFLALERRRTVHSTRWFLLALVRLQNSPGETGTYMSPALADAVFSSLAGCTRGVDFIGWYRQGRIAGAVLAQAATPPAHVADRLAVRITQTLCGALPGDVSSRLRVRIVHAGRITIRS